MVYLIFAFLVLVIFILLLSRQNKQKTLTDATFRSFDKNVIASKTDLKGRILYVSEAFCTISGYSKEELLGKPHNIVRHPDMPKEAFKEMWATIQSGKTWHGEVKNRKKDGSFYWVEATIEPEINRFGQVVAYNAVRVDITSRKELDELKNNLETIITNRTRELEESKIYLKSLFDTMPNIAVVTKGREIDMVNNLFLEFTGFETLDDFRKEYDCICDMFTEEDGYLRKMMDDDRNWIEHVVAYPHFKHKALITKDNEEYCFVVNAKEIDLGYKKRYIAILMDISPIERISYTDSLTKLYNRNKINTMLRSCEKSYDLCNDDFSVMLIDIDDFKSVNDTYGHLVGDYVLQTISTILRENTREMDFVGRWGGEEFLIICKHTTVEKATMLANTLLEKINTYPFEYVQHKTASFGVSQYRHDDTLNLLIKRADDALYQAKREGKNRVVVL